MSGSNIASDYTSKEGVDVWGRIVSFGRIYNQFVEESGRMPSGKEVERILSVVGAIDNIPTKSRNCSFPPCGRALNIHNQSKFCGACQKMLIDEGISSRKSEFLGFLRQEFPELFSRALAVMPWKLTPAG